MQRFLKTCFYIVLGMVCLGVVYLTTVIYLSPRADLQNRGFIGCTRQMVIDLQQCQAGEIGCPFRHMVKDMKCNIKVVYIGFADWISGNQPTPWANYLFVPELSEITADDTTSATKRQNEMQNLEKRNLFIEQKQQELEDAKQRMLNIDSGELLANPDIAPQPQKSAVTDAESKVDVSTENIDDETNLEF